MANNKYPSLSSFLDSARKIERNTIETSLDAGTESEVKRILNESVVRLSVYNQATTNANVSSEDKGNKSTTDFIQESVKEAVEMNASRVKSILDDLFESKAVSKEREEYWINKLCEIFNINSSLSIEDKSIFLDKQIAKSDDTLNFVTFVVEAGEKSMKKK